MAYLSDGPQEQDPSLDDLFQAVGFCPNAGDEWSHEAGNDGQTWQAILMEVLDTQGLSAAEINRKRKRLTFQAFRDPTMISKTVALESLVSPNVGKMHKFFQRSAAIAELLRLPSTETTKMEIDCLKRKYLDWNYGWTWAWTNLTEQLIVDFQSLDLKLCDELL